MTANHKEMMITAQQDVRAEMLAAGLLQSGLPVEQLLTAYLGQHARAYSRDLESVTAEENQNGTIYTVLRLNRDSLYDTLPEALFHEPRIYRHEVDARIMAADYRERIKEMQAARKFFAPLDQEFFLQKTFTMMDSLELGRQLEDYQWDDELLRFMQIPFSLPRYLVAGLLALLPHRDDIIGNNGCLSHCLSLILSEEVSIRDRYEMETLEGTAAPGLGQAQLGLDMVMGNELAGCVKCYELQVGPLTASSLMNYLGNGSHALFLQTAARFFLPLEAEMKISLIIDKKTQAFMMNETPAAGRLGFTSTL